MLYACRHRIFSAKLHVLDILLACHYYPIWFRGLLKEQSFKFSDLWTVFCNLILIISSRISGIESRLYWIFIWVHDSIIWWWTFQFPGRLGSAEIEWLEYVFKEMDFCSYFETIGVWIGWITAWWTGAGGDISIAGTTG